MTDITADLKSGKDSVGNLTLKEKTFSTGSRGFHASGKVTIQDKRYQANFILVEIGSKPQGEGKKDD